MRTKTLHTIAQISHCSKAYFKLKAKTTSVFFGMCFFFIGISSYGQCAMCRAALESEGNGTKAQAVNDGIVYLMAIPYLLVACIGYYVYKMYRKNHKNAA